MCDGFVTREKLDELMVVGTERPALDYKATVDLNDTKQTIEFARDVAGMASNPKGGYIVYGLDGKGQPATDQLPIDVQQFDEAKLRDKIKKYLGHGFGLTVAVHEVQAHPVAVVFVGRVPFGMIPMQCEGKYKDRSQSGPPKEREVFRAGDIFVRWGTQTIRLAPGSPPRQQEQGRRGPGLRQCRDGVVHRRRQNGESARCSADAAAPASGAMMVLICTSMSTITSEPPFGDRLLG